MSKLQATTYLDAVKILRNEIILQTQLQGTRVLNATSVRGPDLLKVLDNLTATTSPHLDNTFIVFELKENQSEFYSATEANAIQMEGIIPYDMILKIYGNNCHDVSREILAQFKNKEVALKLRNSGIWVYNISRAENINEFINRTVWPRCDITINVATRFEITKKTTSANVSKFKNILNINTKGEN